MKRVRQMGQGQLRCPLPLANNYPKNLKSYGGGGAPRLTVSSVQAEGAASWVHNPWAQRKA